MVKSGCFISNLQFEISSQGDIAKYMPLINPEVEQGLVDERAIAPVPTVSIKRTDALAKRDPQTPSLGSY